MYDGLKIIFNNMQVCESLLGSYQKWLTVMHEWDGGKTVHEYKKIRNINVNIYETGTIVLHGSIHKFFMQGMNNNLFTLADMEKAINELSNRFLIPLNADCIKRVELGVNIPTNHPNDIVRAARTYHGKVATKYIRKDNCCYKEWELKEYDVKLYQKGSDRVRLEIRIKEKAKKEATGVTIFQLNDMIDRNKFTRGLYTLYDTIINDFIFAPDISSPLQNLELRWNLWQQDSYWENLSPNDRRREKKKIESILAGSQWDYKQELKRGVLEQGALMLGMQTNDLFDIFAGGQWDYKQELGQGVLEQGALTLGTQTNDLFDIFWVLGLSGQKVAGPKGDGDLHHAQKNKKTILVNVFNPVVRNIGYNTDVIIFGHSYNYQLPRGPPTQLNTTYPY